MFHHAKLLIVAGLSAALCTGAWAQQNVKTDAETLLASIDLMLLDAIETAFFVEDGVAALLGGEANHHFHQARELFLNRAMDRSASQLRTAAAVVGLEAVLTVDDGDYNTLMISYYELLFLSEDVEGGRVRSAAPLSNAFVRAHRALAKARLSKARQYWELGGQARVGVNLRAANRNIDQWAAWRGHEFTAKTRARLAEARSVANALIDGGEFSSADVGMALELAAAQIEALDKGTGPAYRREDIDTRKKSDETKRAKRSAKRKSSR